MEYVARILKDESAQDLVEYALLLGGIAVIVAASMVTLSATMSTVWTNTSNQVSGS